MPLVPVDINKIKLDSAPAGLIPVDINSIKLDAPAEPSFLDRLQNDFASRVGTISDAMMNKPNQSDIETGLQETGQIAGFLGNDIPKQIFNSVASSIPQSVKDAGSFVLNANKNTPAGLLARAGSVALDAGMAKYNDFAQDNPRAARNIDAVANIGGLVSSFLPIGESKSLVSTALDSPTAVISAAKPLAADLLEKVPVLDNALGTTIRPTATDLKQVARKNYALADQSNAVLSKDFTNNFIDHAQSFGPKDEMAAKIGGENPVSQVTQDLAEFKDQPMTLQRATAVDQALTEKLDDPKFTDKNGVLNTYGRQLLEVKNNLRQSLVDAADNGHVEGGAEGINAYRTAVKDYAAQSQINDIQRIVDRASYMDNPATALKTGFRNIAVNPGRLSKYSPEVQKAIKNAARDGDLANILRTELGSRLISTTMGAAAGALGGPIGSLAGAAAGMASSRYARGAAESMQMGRVNNVIDAIAGTSSLPTKTVPLSQRLKSEFEARKLLQKVKK